MRRLIVRWATWLAGLIAVSIPTVDMVDVFLPGVGWVDDLYTLVACAALVWLVSIVKRFNQK